MRGETKPRQRQKRLRLGEQDPLEYSRLMVALARRGGEAPKSLSPEEIQELCLTVELHYAAKGIR